MCVCGGGGSGGGGGIVPSYRSEMTNPKSNPGIKKAFHKAHSEELNGQDFPRKTMLQTMHSKRITYLYILLLTE